MASPIVPRALKPGATIAFVSPSARLNDVFPAAISRAITLFSSHGYKVRIYFTPDSGIQSSIANRLSELRSAFLDSTVSAIICTIGGETFTELLPALIADHALHATIRANPKIVVGYSNMTGLHWWLYALTGLRTFYGPSAIPELGTADNADDPASPLAFCVKHLLKMVSNPEPLSDVPRSLVYAPQMPPFFHDPTSTDVQKLAPTPAWRWLRPGRAQGRLFGGCLSNVVRLNGVRALAPNWRGRIVFLETSAEEEGDLGKVQTGIADLIAQGVFEEAAGLVVGRPFGYESEQAQQSYADIITALLCQGGPAESGIQFPILYNADIGHSTPMITLPFDVLAVLDSDKDQFTLLEAGVL